MTAGTCRRDLPSRWWRHRSGTASPTDRTTKETHTLRKIILGLVATAAIAAPLALSAPANAATLDANGVVTVAKGDIQNAWAGTTPGGTTA